MASGRSSSNNGLEILAGSCRLGVGRMGISGGLGLGMLTISGNFLVGKISNCSAAGGSCVPSAEERRRTRLIGGAISRLSLSSDFAITGSGSTFGNSTGRLSS
ncbi:hypothetical protein HCG51_12845 [Tolypothrix sp. PCC 7910]|nr:hypothetical protein HCG51_12845 [Tolypothrix sp. PCC 7910]